MFKELDEPDHRRQLRDSARDFIRRRGGSRDVRAALSTGEGFCRQRLRDMAELGWTGLLIPEEMGGVGLLHGEVAALHHELGRSALPEPLIAVALLAARAVALGESATLKRELLPGLLDGSTIAGFAWQDGAGALGADGVGPVARPGLARGWAVSGTALFVPLAPTASGTVVAARAEGGIMLGWIGDLAGISIECSKRTDGSGQASMHFSDVAVPAEHVLAGPERGGDLLEELLDTARLAVSAQLLGTMEQIFEMTLAYLRQRHQFGKAIGSFQVLQHRAVDLYMQIELARSALGRAVRALEAGAPAGEQAAAVSAAKSRCSDAALKIVKQGIQMHGAIAYTEEYDLSLYVRRALALSGSYGNALAHRRRYAASSGLGATV